MGSKNKVWRRYSDDDDGPCPSPGPCTSPGPSPCLLASGVSVHATKIHTWHLESKGVMC